jgi:hypothetical protein
MNFFFKKQDGRSYARSRNRSSSRNNFTAEVDRDSKLQLKENVCLKEQHNRDARGNSRLKESHDVANRAVPKKWSRLERPDSFDCRDTYQHSMKVRHWFV